MSLPRTLAGALAVNRTLFGLNYLLRPQAARSSWIGRSARKPGTQVMTRSQGIRDVALGAGALRALARDQPAEARGWVAAHAAADLTDFVATWAARDRLPGSAARLALVVAGASATAGAVAALGLRAGD